MDNKFNLKFVAALGQSLVERRLEQLRDASVVATPPAVRLDTL